MLLDRCPWYIAGPILGAMIVGLPVAMGLLVGVTLQRVLVTRHTCEASAPAIPGL